jgi:hypothetical protein
MYQEEISKNRSITTTVSLPFFLYLKVVEKAQTERISISQVVRLALYQEFEREKKDKGK